MQSRREVLRQALLVALARQGGPARYEIIAQPNCLSQESAEGYRRLLERHERSSLPSDLIVVAGAGGFAWGRMPELRARVLQGARVIWEDAPSAFQPAEAMYVRYSWPVRAMVRSFGTLRSVTCPSGETIASCLGEGVSFKCRIGNGCFIFLGSMLGPHLRAGDREAQELAARLMHLRS